MVGIDRKKENSRAAVRDMPATCPAAMVDREREVPGKTADATWQMPIQMAWTSETSSMRSVMWRPTVRGEPKYASTIHMMTPPTSSETPITVRLSRCLPISLVSSSDGTAVQINAIITSESGCVSADDLSSFDRGPVSARLKAASHSGRQNKQYGSHNNKTRPNAIEAD